MSIKRILIVAAGLASVALPGAASAQNYGYNGYNGYGGQGRYDRHYDNRYDGRYLRDRHDDRRRWREIERRRRWEWKHRHHGRDRDDYNDHYRY